MKRMIVMIASILVFLFTTGCSQSRELAVGHWSAEVDMTDLTNESIIEGMGEATGEVDEIPQMEGLFVMMDADFNEDGTFEMGINRASCEAYYQSVCDQCIDYMYQVYGQMIEQNGLDITVDELLESAGYTMEDIVGQFESSVDIDAMVQESTISGKYVMNGNRVFITVKGEEGTSIDAGEVNGDTMTFIGPDEDNEYARLYPFVFKKQ